MSPSDINVDQGGGGAAYLHFYLFFSQLISITDEKQKILNNIFQDSGLLPIL